MKLFRLRLKNFTLDRLRCPQCRSSPVASIALVVVSVRSSPACVSARGPSASRSSCPTARASATCWRRWRTPVGRRAGSASWRSTASTRGATTPVGAGDEVALIPPVSGGAGPVRLVRVTGEPLDVAALAAAVRDPRAGAVVLFEGVTREVAGARLRGLRGDGASAKLRAIAEEEAERHGLCAVALEHRTGTVPLSEPSVIVAASAPHRGEAFAGARALIDRVKAEAPIWKVEVTAPAAARRGHAASDLARRTASAYAMLTADAMAHVAGGRRRAGGLRWR